MRVLRVIAVLVDDAVDRSEAGEGVDVGVGVVAFQVAVVQPQHALLLHPVGHVGAERGTVALRVALVQALPGGQQGAGTVGIDRAAFQGERNAADIGLGVEHAGAVQHADQLVVEAGVELAAPAGETEVQQLEAAIGALEGDRAGVAQPGVVVGGGDEMHALHVHAVRAQAHFRIGLDVIVGHADQHRLEAGDGADQRDVGFLDLGQAFGPVGVGVRPGDQYAGLGFPFGWKAERVVHSSRLRSARQGVGAAGVRLLPEVRQRIGFGPTSSGLAWRATTSITRCFSKYTVKAG